MKMPPVCPAKLCLPMKTIPNNLFFAGVEAEIAAGRPVRFRLKGNSMFPLLRNERDEVLLCPCEAKDLKPMDVVLFRYRGSHVLHRILRREGDNLLIQGDGVYASFERCQVADVVGIVREVYRPSGKVLSVDNWEWTLPSRLWRGTGVFRSYLIRFCYKIKVVKVDKGR